MGKGDGSRGGSTRVDQDKTVELTRSKITRLSDLQETHRPCLLVIAGPAMGRIFRLEKDSTVVGRAAEADVVIVDDGISRKHARIDRMGEDHLVIDLGSTNGVFINNDKVDQAPLADGDRIRLGSSTILKFSLQDEVEESFQKRMYDSAVRDPLTSVYNKGFFLDCIKNEFAHHARHRVALSVVMVDIDHFKRVNDTYGHQVGDQVLKTVAHILEGSLRTEDVLCRYGGEEFAIILRSTGPDEALLVCERVRERVARQPFEHEGTRYTVTVSLGIATLEGESHKDAPSLVRAADGFLYAAKQGGRNQTQMANLSERMRRRTERRT